MSVTPIARMEEIPWERVNLAFLLQIHLPCVLLLDISRTFQPGLFSGSVPDTVVWKS